MACISAVKVGVLWFEHTIPVIAVELENGIVAAGDNKENVHISVFVEVAKEGVADGGILKQCLYLHVAVLCHAEVEVHLLVAEVDEVEKTITCQVGRIYCSFVRTLKELVST